MRQMSEDDLRKCKHIIGLVIVTILDVETSEERAELQKHLERYALVQAMINDGKGTPSLQAELEMFKDAGIVDVVY